MMQLRKLNQGQEWQVVAPVDHRGDCAVEAFLEELADNRSTKAIAAGLLAIWSRIPKEGPHELPTDWFHCVDSANQIYEFIKGSYRVLCFVGQGRLIVCGTVFMKKQRKTPEAEKARAVALRKAYLTAVAENKVVVVG